MESCTSVMLIISSDSILKVERIQNNTQVNWNSIFFYFHRIADKLGEKGNKKFPAGPLQDWCIL